MRFASVVWIPLGLALAGAPAALAAEFIVDSVQDAQDANPGDGACAAAGGACTLRAAIQETNALPGPDVVRLPGGAYALAIPGAGEDQGATGDLDVTDGLTLLGDGSDVTVVDAMALDRVFHVASTEPVEMVGLSVVGGASSATELGAGILVTDPFDFFDLAGGALFEDVVVAENGGAGPFPSAVEVEYADGGGDVVFQDSSISDNLADGLVALGYFADVELTRTRVVANEGSGIEAADMGIDVYDSEVSENAGYGVAASDSWVTVERSTVGWNERDGLAALGYADFDVVDSLVRENLGAGLYNVEYFQDMRVLNTTITGNGDSGILNGGALTVANSTIVANTSETHGGGVRAEDIGAEEFSVSIRSSIVAGNEAPDAPDCVRVDGQGASTAFPSDGYNLVGDPSGCDFAATTGDRVGVNPGLGPLADHGGPTETFSLLPGSPALDAIPEADCVHDPDGYYGSDFLEPVLADQRGVARPQGAGCDVGAFEAVQVAVAVDVKPGQRRNVVAPFSRGRIEVALLSAPDFDATGIDAATVRFGPSGAEAVKAKRRDVNRDGRRDLLVKFRIQDTGIALGDREACLAGTSAGGDIVSGCDTIDTVPPHGRRDRGKVWAKIVRAWIERWFGWFGWFR